MNNIKKSTHAIIGSLLGVIACLIMYALMKFRLLPFLKNEVVVTQGQEIPTQVYIDSTLPMFLYAIPVFILVGIVNFYFSRNK